jgi:MFS family permease
MTGVRLTKRGFSIIAIFLFTLLTWYYVVSFVVLEHVVGSSTETYLTVYAIFNFIIALTLLLSSFYIGRFDTIRIIYGCSIAISAVAPILFVSNINLRLVIIFIQGVLFGIGQLAAFMYFWNITVSEERGRTVGIIGLFSLPLFQVITLMSQNLDFSGAVMLTIILSLGTLTVILLKPEKKVLLTTKKDEKGYYVEKRTVLLYTIPWVIFSLINLTLARNISINVFDRVPSYVYMLLIFLQTVAVGFGALGGGMIADFLGRRLSITFGLSIYGISSALAGFTKNYEVLYFVYLANGLNWGILWVLYGSVVWGDLANKETCAKRFGMGLLIFYLATGFGFLFTDQISLIPLITSSLISCILIFLSNIPLILAPELLSLDFREKIRLKLHMNVIRKIKKQSNA